MASKPAELKDFDWSKELERTVVHSLATSFGLDFLLFEDKKGGNVDTIHNVRQGVYATMTAEQQYEQREKYNSVAYHSHEKYVDVGKKDDKKQQNGGLFDKYRGENFSINEKRQLDHIISAHEIAHDAGRVLADLSGVDLANQQQNLSSTLAYINIKKSKKSVEEFVSNIPAYIQDKQKSIAKKEAKLAIMPNNTPAEQHARRKLEDDIRKDKGHVEALESIDKEGMLKADKVARDNYNSQINWSYYTGSKFLKNTAMEAGKASLKMGFRQGLGLVLAEIWFELKEQIPIIYQNVKTNFTLDNFINHIKTTLSNIWERIKLRFKDLLNTFKDGVISGILSSLTTTLLNAFKTIGGNIIKLIRETWSSLVKAAKLVFFNPENLRAGQLVKELSKIIGLAVATSLGTVLNQYLGTVFSFPFGTELAAFVSALSVGLMTLGMTYFFDHSELMQKVWAYLDSLRNRYDDILVNLKEINAGLDEYLIGLSKTELGLNPVEIQIFTNDLVVANSEFERSVILNREVVRRNIDLPFKAGDMGSMRNFLKNL